MNRRRNARVCCLLVSLSYLNAEAARHTLIAQANSINAERPSFSNSSAPVGRGLYQLESGWAEQSSQDFDGMRTQIIQTPLLFREGFSNDFEGRLSTDGYTWKKKGHAWTEGMGDTSLGFKWRHARQKRVSPSLASIVTVILPSGNSEIRGHGIRPDYTLPIDWNVSPFLALTVMPGITYNSISSGRYYVAPLASALINFGWSPRLHTFGECAGQQFAEPRFGGNVLTADLGVTYLLTSRLEIDGAVGWGLNHFSPNAFATAGLSARL